MRFDLQTLPPGTKACRRDALRLSLTDSRLPESQREQHVTAFLRYADAMNWSLDRQWWISRGDDLIWSCLSLASPGGSTILIMPHPANLPIPDIAEAVLAVVRSERDRGLRLIQVLLDPDDIANRHALEAAGFREVAMLDYLERVGPPSAAPRGTNPPAFTGANWTNYSDAQHPRFSSLIARSYRDSLDCPGLSGMRTVEDAIDGHKAAGRFDPAHWWLLELDGRPAACILFGLSPIRPSAELVYMGVDPDCRGRGVGRYVLDHGLRSIALSGCGAITLAVDERNVPAIRLYERAGFSRTHVRRAMIHHAAGCG